MDSPQILNSVDRTTGSEDATGRRMASIVRRIAFVAVLASGAFVDLRMHTNAASDLQPPALPGPTAVSAPGTGNDAAVRMAPSATEYYFPAQHTNQAKSSDGNVMTYEHD
jgi:hypothetical protein